MDYLKNRLKLKHLVPVDIFYKFFVVPVFIFQFLFLCCFFDKPLASESILNSLEKCEPKRFNCEKSKTLYELLNFQTIWSERRIQELKILTEKSKFEGLEPADFKIDFTGSKIEKELKLTKTLIKLAYNVYYGSIDPIIIFDKWNFPKKEDRVIQTLVELIKNDNISALFERLSPKYENYRVLKEYLRKYYELLAKKRWDRIEVKEKVKQGETHPSIPAIKERLYLLGYLNSYSPSQFFDEELKEAVIKFQLKHNLETDGVLGKNTIRALNISPKEIITKIRINLEKYRWLPETLGEKFLFVNIPSFEIDLYEKGQILLQSKIIAGKDCQEDFRPTPLLYSKITQVVINPDWYIPHKIAVKDMLPKIAKNNHYLKMENIKVYLNGEEIDPSTIEWNSVDEKNFNFRLIQKAGKSNALGRIKFHMPNDFDVYLHDTPDKKLFSKSKRAFSSGCIRIEKALPLALKLLGDNNTKNWDDKKIMETLKSEKTFYINLKNPVPIYILYFTTLVKDSDLYFFEDIYKYDKTIAKYLIKN